MPGGSNPRLRFAVAGAAALVVALLAWLILRPDTYSAELSDPATQADSESAAIETVAALQDAIRQHDKAAVRELAANDLAADQLAAAVTNARTARITDFSLRFVDLVRPATDNELVVAADVAWKYAGFDEAPARTEMVFTLRMRDNEAQISGVGGNDRRTPIWFQGELRIQRDKTALVLAAGDPQRAERVTTMVRKGIRVNQRVLTSWEPSVVVEVPDTAEKFQATLGDSQGRLSQVAAVTTAPDGLLTPQTPVHIFINPGVFNGLDDVGAQVVMSHEITHVATDATQASLPTWLSEGFADYVALRDVDLPVTTTAKQAIAEARKSGVPPQLPPDAEFNTQATHIGATYEKAWLVCRALADIVGERDLIAIYREVSRTGDLASTLQKYDTSQQEILRAWQQDLKKLSGD